MINERFTGMAFFHKKHDINGKKHDINGNLGFHDVRTTKERLCEAISGTLINYNLNRTNQSIASGTGSVQSFPF